MTTYRPGIVSGVIPQPIQTPSIPQAIAQRVIQMIGGVWRAGDQLPPQRTLARQLGASMASLREALQTLQEIGVVELRHNVPCGIHIANLEWLAEWRRRGMRLICYSTDLNFLRQGAASGINRLKAPGAGRAAPREGQQALGRLGSTGARHHEGGSDGARH